MAKVRSCNNCPAFLTVTSVGTSLGREIGAPGCRTLGIPLLLTPNVGTKKGQVQLEVIAGSCEHYGKTNLGASPVFLGAPGVGLQIGPPKDEGKESAFTSKPMPTTCGACSQFISADEVSDRTGWTGVGACAARGMLVPVHKKAEVGKLCVSPLKDFAVKEDAVRESASLDDFKFNSIFGISNNALVKNATVVDVQSQEAIDPNVYATDAPVSASDSLNGIRAWRLVKNPKRPSQGGVLLAIYNSAPISEGGYFEESERVKIPQRGVDPFPELYRDYSDNLYKLVVAWNELGETPMLWGPAGTGKTDFFRWMAYLMQLPFERLSITATTEVDEIVGKMMFTNGETQFQMGRLPLAWSKPCVVVIDEPNVAPPEVWHVLRPLTDNAKQLVIDANHGERIEQHPDSYLGMAANPAWDVRNESANSLADADSSRLLHMYVDLPDEETEMGIIKARVSKDDWEIQDDTLRQMMAVARDIREASNNGGLPISWGIRHQIKVARALKWFSPVDAYRMAATDFLEPQYRELILGFVRATMRSNG
jgi:MoxR-like ATPase